MNSLNETLEKILMKWLYFRSTLIVETVFFEWACVCVCVSRGENEALLIRDYTFLNPTQVEHFIQMITPPDIIIILTFYDSFFAQLPTSVIKFPFLLIKPFFTSFCRKHWLLNVGIKRDLIFWINSSILTGSPFFGKELFKFCGLEFRGCSLNDGGCESTLNQNSFDDLKQLETFFEKNATIFVALIHLIYQWYKIIFWSYIRLILHIRN